MTTDTFDFESRRQSREELYNQLIAAGAKPQRNNTFCCPYHNDNKPSAGIKKGSRGWIFHCFVCGCTKDVWDVEAELKGISLSDLLKERLGNDKTTAKWQYIYKDIDGLLAAIDAVDIEECNKYTNPETGNIDLLTIRYLPRGGGDKKFLQAHQTPKGFVPKRPAGLLPLFNRIRLGDSDTILYVEGEKCVRKLFDLGFTATTGSGGSKNADSHDYSPLSGKKVILWADYDITGKQYMEQVRDKLLELENSPTIFSIDIEGLELPEGGDIVNLCEKVLSEGGTAEDCKDFVQSLVDDASEVNRLQCLEDLLTDMREGRYTNLPLMDFPIITNEANMLLNKRIGIVYGGAGHGKSLIVGKICDDLLLAGYKVARLQLEDEMEQHLLRALAQQSLRGELANPSFHRENPDASKVIYDQFKATIDTIAASIVAGEHESWDDKKLLGWIESKLKAGMDLVVADPVSVVLDKNVWITSHRLMWGLKKLLAAYPSGRVLLVSHPNAEGDISGGQSYKRFSHCMLLVNRFKKPKKCEILDNTGAISIKDVYATIGIVKARYGPGQGLEIAIELDSSSLKMREIGIVVREIKERKPVGREFSSDNDIEL